MVKTTLYSAAAALFLLNTAAFAAEKTVTLAVENMTCAACPHIVKGSLAAVPGVTNVVVSFEDKTAFVTYDDAKTAIPALVRATTVRAIPLHPRVEEAMLAVKLVSTITCPVCGHRRTESMPADACQYFYECSGCKTVLKPKAGDCCVFCSFGDEPCPPIQEARASGVHTSCCS